MNKTLKIDINAHIKNLTCKINTVGQDNVASISFDNLGFGTITAIKFKAVAYDSFNSVLKINDNNIFSLAINDICIPENTFSEYLKVPMPLEVKKLDLKEEEISYVDNTTTFYKSADIREFDIEYFDLDENEEDILKAKAIQEKYGKTEGCILCKAKNFECGWICSCGRYNKPEFDTCSNCEVDKKEILESNSEEGLKKVLLEYKIKNANKAFEESTNIKEYKETINLFEEIPEYEDSESMIEKCRRKINIRKKIAIISPITLVAIIGIVMLWTNIISPWMKHNDAMNLAYNGQYDEAKTMCQEFTNDPEKLNDLYSEIDEVRYQKAVELKDNNDYDSAVAEFTALGDYKDSKTMLSEIHYQKAIELKENNDYDNAVTEFNASGDYKDSREQIHEITYQQFLNLISDGKYLEATKKGAAFNLKVLYHEAYKDSIEKFLDIRYKAIKQADIGDKIYFGDYETFCYNNSSSSLYKKNVDEDCHNKTLNSSWIVLDKQDSKILIITLTSIGFKKYNEIAGPTSWEKCSLRDYLNTNVINEVFNDAERSVIQTTTTSDQTNDKIFCLSIDEVKKYLPILNADSSLSSLFSGMTLRTTYPYFLNPYPPQQGYMETGPSNNLAARKVWPVDDEGEIHPAMWIDTSLL